MIGDAALSQQVANRLLELGIYVIGFFYPVVSKGTARIRTQVSAAHARSDLQTAIDAFAKVKEEFELR
jgi:glycine C-acetyltransferase